jgi:hypothetical protein
MLLRCPVGSHPANLAFRFLLELLALLIIGLWGWNQDEGATRILLAVGAPAIAAALWGALAVPGDPSRSGSAPIAVPGVLRLALESLFFAFATWALYTLWSPGLGILFAIAVLVHYAISYDRIIWLISR